MEETAWALVAAAGAMLVKPVRERVVPVAKAVGKMGRDVGLTAAAGAGQVVATARHPHNGARREATAEHQPAKVAPSTARDDDDDYVGVAESRSGKAKRRGDDE